MAEFNGYEPGTPSWVDLGSTDPATSRAFYTDLFGWGVRDAGPEPGGYALFTLRDKPVAGVGPTAEEESCWTTCFAVADADEIVARAEKAGGTIVRATFDVDELGRTAVLADPEGAVFAIWQYRTGKGAEIANEPVSLSWNELATRDLAGAKTFYAEVFGWTIEDVALGDGDYTVVRVADRGVAGIWPMGEVLPPEVPPHWFAYFAVDDADATTAMAEELGGRVLDPPRTIATVGRFAVLGGPHGEAFAVIRNE